MDNEQRCTATLRDNVITDPRGTLWDIHNQLYLMFHSLLEEIYNVYTSQDLVRVYITHEELVNTNIIVGPDYLGNITADIIMNQIAYVVHSNNFIPANGGLIINIAAIHNIKGLRHKIISNMWKHMHQKRCILMVENDDELCLPHCIALGIAHTEHQADPTNSNLCRNYDSMCKKDRRYVKLRDTSSLQKCTTLKYQSIASFQLNSPSLLKHTPLYEKALGVGITVISAWGGNKRIYQSDPQYTMQIILYHIHSDINDLGHYAVITHINALLGKSYYCSHCDVAFNNSTKHQCRVWCNVCEQDGCVVEDASTAMVCDTCYAPCHSTECMEAHKTRQGRQNSSMCDTMLLTCPLHVHYSRLTPKLKFLYQERATQERTTNTPRQFGKLYWYSITVSVQPQLSLNICFQCIL